MKPSYEKIHDYCILDLETTGLSSDFDEIIEVGILKIRDKNIIDKFHSYVKPNFFIPDYITELTGITNEMVKDSPIIDNIIDDIFSFIDNNVIIGHNVRFDIRFLNASSRNKSIESDIYLDTMLISRKILPELPHHRLKDITKHLQINTNVFHNSIDDCLYTKAVYDELFNIVEKNCLDLTSSKENQRIKLSDLVPSENVEDDNYLYKKHVCFTGTLSKMTRQEAAQRLVNIGGFADEGVNSITNFLVIGITDYSKVKNGLSNKHKKALNLLSKGYDISVITENEFYDFINLQ